jgi:integrase
MRRKEKTYRPEDMWTIEDSEIFFKYCPDPRIICYHSIGHATGARPNEILGLMIGDIIWPADGTAPYFTVKGKTGQRTLRMYRFEDYVKEFIEGHPRRAISTSPLIWSKKTGGKLGRAALTAIYSDMKEYFSKLVNDAIGQDDRNAIIRLLRKPWNPYVFRHSVTTEFLGYGALTKHQGDQFFGWSPKGNTAVHYQNYFGNEASDSLGAYFGLVKRQPPKIPKQRQCLNINCQERVEHSRSTIL